MEEYKYECLDLENPAIRLLRLHHGVASDISCELFQAELHQRQDSVSYEALSYTWGSSELSERIRVNGYRMNITQNLHEALLHLRKEDEDRVLWIDAVCINQANLKERGHQVAQMGDIYKEADRVIFRLGMGSHATDILMDSLRLLQQASTKHACRTWSRYDGRWEHLWASSRSCLEMLYPDLQDLEKGGLEEILGRPWFRRVWILQEAAFAQAGIISCGTKSVSARLFTLAPLLLGITPDAHCQSVIDIMPSQWRSASWLSANRSLYSLLGAFGCSEATEPRDLVYALRGISSDVRDTTILMPDYNKPEREIVRELFRYIYSCEPEHLEPSLRPHSIRHLTKNLHTHIDDEWFLRLAQSSLQCTEMEALLTRPELTVSQQIFNAAAECDRSGKTVEVLLRRRREEFSIGEALSCAAKNPYAAREVLDCCLQYEGLVITNRVFAEAAKNSQCGFEAVDFLLSLSPTESSIMAVSNAVCYNSSDVMREQIRNLVRQILDGSNITTWNA
ncbi:hypothetical protein TgHK011_000076 [Trichoderma gracile]|nr:hypothetical protein TgHK011_000076 [Trichoderma gracile]